MNRTCSPGEYEIFVSVGLMDGTPVFELPYNDSDSHKRYKLGKVIIIKNDIMKNYLFLLLFLFCINAYSQKNSGIFYSTLFTKEGVYLRNDDFGNNADYVFFCDVNGDALDDGVAYYPSQKSGNLSVALSDGV